jgi:hypothetical protein
MFERHNPPVEDLINDKDLVLKLKAGSGDSLSVELAPVFGAWFTARWRG